MPVTEGMMATTSLDDKTLLLAIDFGRFGNSRKLRDDQYEVEADKTYTGAERKRLRSKALAAIRNFDNATRRWVEAKTLPALIKPGIYRLPKDKLSEVLTELVARKAHRTSVLVEKFRAEYEADVAQARKDLNGLFDPDDYPPVDAAVAEFDMTWRFLSSGVPDNLRAIDPAVHMEEQTKYAEHLVEAQKAYTSLLRVAMADLVDHLVAMLQPLPDGRKRRVFAAGFDNLSEFLKEFPSRNVAEDAELAALAKQAERMLSGVVIDDVRDDEKTRQYVFDQFATIKGTLDTLVTDEDRAFGKRKIKLTDAA